MEITTYNADGTINETKHIDLQVPKYVKKYDEQNSFLNITAEEVEVVNLRKNTFRKALLLRRLTAAIKHDYANFQDAYRMEVGSITIDIDVYVQKAGADPLIQTGDRIMTSIMRIYGSHSLYRHVKIIDDEQTFFEQVCTKKELYIYINKVEHQTVDGFGNLSSSNWINVLFYHAIKSANTNRFYRWYPNDATRFYFCLQNLINRYYYSLRNMEQAVKWMPDELKQQMYVLSAFVKKARMEYVLCFDEFRVIPKIVNALSQISAQHRRGLYEMFDIVYGGYPSIEFDNRFVLHMRTKELPKPINKEYEVTLHDCNRHPSMCFIINDDEICALRIPSSSNNGISTLQGALNDFYKKHIAVYQNKWESNIQTDSEIYFNKQRPYHEDWLGFYHHKIEKYKNVDLSASDIYKPQLCFYLLLCNNVNPSKMLSFNTDIIADLIELLKKEINDKGEIIDNNKANLCDSQIGLYECMFKINLIKGHIVQRSASDNAVSRAMKYLEPLFAQDCEHVEERFREKLRVLMQNLLNYQGIKPEMAQIKPNGFTGGFNLHLVYNILGTLRTTVPAILINGKDKIDDDLELKAVQSGVIHKDNNKIRGHLMYDRCNIYNKYYNEIVKLIYSFINRITDNSN